MVTEIGTVAPCWRFGTGTVEALQSLYIPAVPTAVPWVPVSETVAEVLFNVPKVTFETSISLVLVALEVQ
jgi:hypothetical protein